MYELEMSQRWIEVPLPENGKALIQFSRVDCIKENRFGTVWIEYSGRVLEVACSYDDLRTRMFKEVQ
ncbi:hypothetical protein [Levilactobacillus fujinensis]|uniref:Uncharacterized protein n=1 Tax=Levilactobacillus fujinensis TaxID=2486024 RepID=A0ABW1TKT1_9LACO|nr:hypothetical protein [Levilactobacillus fujinensis]